MKPVIFLWQAVLAFVYPPHCLICRTPLAMMPGLCAQCEAKMLDNDLEISDIEGIPLVALTVFGSEVRQMIHLLKYGNRTLPGRLLGNALGERLLGHPFLRTEPVVVPVPLHPARRRERGYNQSAVIAGALGKRLGLTMREGVLRRIRATPSQTQLDARARRDNVRNAFAVKKKAQIAGQTAMLIDDVVTTGATVSACAEALRAGGAREVLVCAIARPLMGQ